MSVKKKNDSQLVRAFNKGDVLAFEEFMYRHQDQIYRLASLNLYQSDSAADVTQEVFLRAYKGLNKFRFGAEPKTWLYRVTKNVCMEFNRKVSSNERINKDMEMNMQSVISGEAERNIEKKEAITVIRELISHLSQRQKDVVMFRIFEELSVKETASILGCKPGTVKATLNKAIKTIRDKYNIDKNLL